MEKLAVIQGARLGWHPDYQCLTMTFATYVSEDQAASQSVRGVELAKAFEDTRASNVEWFNGKACWVEVDDNNRSIVYLRMFKSQ